MRSESLNGIVVRPALLYGRSGSLLAPLFKSAYEGNVAWYGRPGGRYAMIHQDDLADLILKAAEKSYLVKGCIFDAANNTSESVDDVLGKLVRVSGAKAGYSYLEPSNRASCFSVSYLILKTFCFDLQHTRRHCKPPASLDLTSGAHFLVGSLGSLVWSTVWRRIMHLGRLARSC